MKNEKILTPESLRSIAKLLFNKSRLSGGELARMLHYDANALWLDVHQRGLSEKKAYRIAERCLRWAGELAEAAHTLIDLRDKAKLTKAEYLKLKRKKSAKRNRRT